MKKYFIDAGCHKGQSIIKAQSLYGKDIQIIGFEAVPYLAYALQSYYSNNKNIQINWNAVWVEDKPINLNIPKTGASWSNSVYSRWDDTDTLTHKVPGIDISSWIKNNFSKEDYIVLKLDIEGAEYEVLDKMIKDGTVDYINEFHGEWHESKINNIPNNAINNVKEYFRNKEFNIWEAPWYDEGTEGMVKFPPDLDPSVTGKQSWGEVNPFDKITFVIPSRNNLEFLQLAYKSIRNLDTKHEVLVLNDASTDGTQAWIEEQNDKDLITYHNPGPDRIGIVGMFDKGIEMARTDIIMAFHSDMVACKDLDKNILKHLTKGKVVSATRVEPPLHPDGPEKILRNYGIETDEFNFDTWYEGSEKLKEDKTTEGIFAPWCMYKEDFLAVGGHDELFAPQSKEDSDLFNRFQLNGYKFIQPWDALVYHFTSRGSRFNKHAGGAAGKNSNEWIQTTTRNGRNFIRKWGHFIKHDPLMKPIIPPKYDIGFIVKNSQDVQLIEALEPWCTTIYVDASRENYIELEQKNTLYDLSEKVRSYDSEKINEILINIDGKLFNQQDFQTVQQLSEIIKDSGQVGEFELGNLFINIIEMNEYQDDLIKL